MDEDESCDLALLDSRVLSNEGAVVELIRKRYARDKIYTDIGDVLISVNPFKHLGIYGPEWIRSYQQRKSRKGFSPHVYFKGKDVLRSLYFLSENQCCIVTGDSGAGKTETVKHILQYITLVSKSRDAKIASKLLQVHCIAEAFGNATMLQNKNSSRLALYLEILFSHDSKLSGGQVYHYMLEKSRIVHREKGGKNFHIFHYLLSGMSVDQLQEYSISTDYPHRYLSYDPMVPPVDEISERIESEKFTKLLTCMESLGFSSTDSHNIFKVLAAVLHIGNVAFATVNSQTNAAFIKDQQPVHCASALLGVDVNDLGTSLVTGTAFHKGEKVSIRKNAEIAGQGRDNLAKALYSRLFSWIVFKINGCLLGNDDAVSRQPAVGPSLGLLDVFGFEKFDVNGLEQLCVNMTNEQLAYFYNERVFAWEQAQLESDGLRTHKTPYTDNRKALELLLSPPQGLLTLLDEESQSPKASDVAYVKKCDGFHRKHPHYNVAKLSYPAFHIQHHTGNVSYVALGFTDTNLDLLGTSLLHSMQGSSDGFISSLFKARVTGTGSLDLQSERNVPVSNNSTQRKKDKKSPTVRHKEAVVQYLAVTGNRQGFPTLASQFRNSITELMHKVLACDVHFVRCIKPNNQQSPNRFEPDTVLVQARSSAVIPTAHAKSVGFPVWFRFDVFINRFGILVGLPPNAVTKDASQTCQNMLRKLADPRGWKIGKTKVFLMYWCAERLNGLIEGASLCATTIQKVLKGWCARKLYKRLKHDKVAQEKTVGTFLAAIGSQSEEMFQHISNQVMEEDAKERRKRSELATLQRETWSPVKFGQKSPPAMLSVGLDVPDAAAQSQQASSAPTSPQQRVSDLSESSLTDVFTTYSPDRHEPPKKRDSNLSVTSVDSSFSDSGDVHAPLQVWCKVTCFERQYPRGEYTIDRPTIIIDGSSNAFDITRIGLGALPASPDSKVTKVRSYIGKGIQIKNDEDGNVWVTRGSKNPVFVKGHFLSEEVISKRGSLVKDKTVKVFDWDSFVDVIRHYCQPHIFKPDLVPNILSSASVFISFVKDAEEDVETPCWVQLDVLAALEQAKAAFKFAVERKNEERQQKLNSMPAILRPRAGTRARELLAVANAERNVRPQRHIDTAKFKRKAWARKEVSVNPFLYGKKDEFSTLGRRLIEQPRPTSVNSSVESSPCSHVPQSISDAFGGGTGQGTPVSQTRDAVDADASHLAAYQEKPKKKIWARKKSEEGNTKQKS